MKIIQVSAYYPPRLGGMQNVVKELSTRMAEKGHSVTVITSDIGSRHNKQVTTTNLSIKYSWGFDFANTAIAPGIFFKVLFMPKNNAVHIHTPRPFVAEIASLACIIRRIPYVVEVHSDIQPLGFFQFLIPIYINSSWRWLMRRAAMVVFLSKYQETAARKRHNLKRTCVIPNGVDEKYYIQGKEFTNQSTQLLFVGRLNNQKNITFLIDAVELMKEDVTLHIVGEGEMHRVLKKIVTYKKMQNKVILHGKKTGHELLKSYKAADIYVMSSHFEGLSLSMLEAMASGLPVVALDAPGVTEHIANTGVIVKHDIPSVFANTIDKLSRDKAKLKQLSSKSQSYAKSLSWSNVVEDYINVYSKIERT